MWKRLLLAVTALLSMSLTCGWGVPLEGLASHCPPGTIDCGPGCIAEDTTCCDDTLGGGASQCPTAGMGVGKTCTKRGTGTCNASGPGKYCCGQASLAGDTPSQDINTSFDGNLGVFCGTNVIEPGAECCASIAGKKICRLTSTRLYAMGTGGGGGGETGGGSGGGGTAGGGGGVTPSCSTSEPAFVGSARSCSQLGASTCNCNTGSVNRCILKSEFDKLGKPWPGQCKPEGGTGCLDGSGTLIAPCCAGLTCKQSQVCGSGAAGGTCAK